MVIVGLYFVVLELFREVDESRRMTVRGQRAVAFCKQALVSLSLFPSDSLFYDLLCLARCAQDLSRAVALR